MRNVAHNRGIVFAVEDTGVGERYGVIFESAESDWIQPFHLDSGRTSTGLDTEVLSDYRFESKILIEADFNRGLVTILMTALALTRNVANRCDIMRNINCRRGEVRSASLRDVDGPDAEGLSGFGFESKVLTEADFSGGLVAILVTNYALTRNVANRCEMMRNISHHFEALRSVSPRRIDAT
ncbi:hypothetical protein [Paraburkholderia fungorum]|uniref:hypothetical protein n=1 Tax=Paraburkholderia fungorum TaxID=134537 RepID=UPI0038B8F58B